MRRAVCRGSLAAALFLWCGVAFAYVNGPNKIYEYSNDPSLGQADAVSLMQAVCDTWNPVTVVNVDYSRTDRLVLFGCQVESGYIHSYFNIQLVLPEQCVVGYVLEGSDCVVVGCTAGEQVQGSFYSDNGDLNDMVLSIQIGDGPVTVSADDCEVTYVPNYDDCYYSGEFGTNPDGVSVEREICNVTFTKTGNSSTVGGTSDEGSTGPASVGDGCLSDDQGNVACGGILPSGCGQINDVDVCFNDGQASCYDIGGTTICAGGAQNCGIFNGENLCVEQVATDSFIKFTDGSKAVLLSKDKGKTTTTVTTTDNGDGTTTKVSETTSNLVGVPDSTLTEMFDANGNLVSSELKGADGPDQGQSQNEFDTTGLATEAGQTSMINKLGEIKDVLDPAAVDTSSIDAAGNGAVGTLDGDAQAFAGSLGDGMPTSDKWLTWSPGFPTPQCQALNIVVPLGPLGNKSLDFDPCSDLQVMRDILGWFFYIGTAFVLVRLTLRGSE
jgi:hypothetical protein